MNDLIYKEEKWDDGYYYKYFVDTNGLKQGEMKVYFADDNGDITDIIHAIINLMNDKYHGVVQGYDRNGLCYFNCNYNRDRLDGLAILANNDNWSKKVWFKNGKRIHENGTPYYDKDNNKLKDDGTLLYPIK